MRKIKPTPIGEKFGRLTVIDDAPWYQYPNTNARARQVLCRCDCGNEIIVRMTYLKTGHTQSCGCYKNDMSYATHKRYNRFVIDGDDCICYLLDGRKFICDKDDHDKIKETYWNINRYGYVVTAKPVNGSIFLHRLLLNCESGEFVDHIDGDKLNNRKRNLRICTKSQNSQNRHTTPYNKCGKVGVTYRKNKNKYEAYIMVDGKNKYLGIFDDVDDAINARIDAERKYYGEFAESAIRQAICKSSANKIKEG